jgi:2-haloacid dehalogenase
MSRAVIFDVNETMLDLGALDLLFANWFGDVEVRKAWFAQTLHYAMTLAATRDFRNFGEIGAEALAAVADQRGVALPEDAPARLRESVWRLPAHADVAPALRILRKAGLVTAALSNNPLPVVMEQMRHTGLAVQLDAIMSVDEAGHLKPAPEVYQFAVTRLGFPAVAIWLVAAHGWDVAGAMRAGLRGALVARPGQRPDPFTSPEIVGEDLVAVANQIVGRAGTA